VSSPSFGNDTHTTTAAAGGGGGGGAGFDFFGATSFAAATMATTVATTGAESLAAAAMHMQWYPVQGVSAGQLPNTVVLNVDAGRPVPLRVRYAYADWPVASVRNKRSGVSSLGQEQAHIDIDSNGGGLPAALFDMPVVLGGVLGAIDTFIDTS
jgi:hypothetical protein